MAANPKVTPNIGQPARATMPLARRALREETELLTRDLCFRCGGTGFIDRPYIECDHPRCHKVFTDEQVVMHLGHGWRRKELPCGHPMPGGQPTFLSAICPTCEGKRHLQRWITLGELLDFFESLYPESISAEITARRSALTKF